MQLGSFHKTELWRTSCCWEKGTLPNKYDRQYRPPVLKGLWPHLLSGPYGSIAVHVFRCMQPEQTTSIWKPNPPEIWHVLQFQLKMLFQHGVWTPTYVVIVKQHSQQAKGKHVLCLFGVPAMFLFGNQTWCAGKFPHDRWFPSKTSIQIRTELSIAMLDYQWLSLIIGYITSQIKLPWKSPQFDKSPRKRLLMWVTQ